MDDIDRRELEMLLDERKIARVLLQYCRALDRCDEQALRDVYHEDSSDDHGVYQGSGYGFVDYVLERVQDMYTATQHSLSNVFVEVEGDKARTESCVCATHVIRPELGGGIYWFAGRYLDLLERRSGVWRVSHRQLVRTWDHVETRERRLAGGFSLRDPAPFLEGARDEGDPVYAMGPTLRHS